MDAGDVVERAHRNYLGSYRKIAEHRPDGEVRESGRTVVRYAFLQHPTGVTRPRPGSGPGGPAQAGSAARSDTAGQRSR
jgi:hypothetical protein